MTEHRFDPGDQRALVERLGQILVGAGFESGDDVLAVGFGRHQNDRHERQTGVGLDLPAGFDAVHLRHHHIEQDQIGMVLPCRGQRFFPVGGFQ